MKSILPSAGLLLLLFCMVSFTPSGFPYAGTYGVSSTDPAQIKLQINEDHTFSYRDFSDPDKKIDVQGKWEKKGRGILLKAANPDISFHDHWKFEKEGKAAHSRRGICWYRLIAIH